MERIIQAYVMQRYGDASCAGLADWPTPEPKANEVLIRVEAMGLNPVDYKIRQGALKPVIRYPLPCVLGNELAGVVEGGGSVRFKAGTRVYARVAKETLGAFADYACVAESLVAQAPRRLSFEQAAAVPLAALTALQALRGELNCQPGCRLLITGGAGGVGSFAIPLAKWLGAHVTTTASARGADLVRSLGADEIIDYRTQRLEDFAGQFDAVFDLVGGDGLNAALACVRRGGRLLSIAAMPEPRTATQDLDRGWVLATLFRAISFRTRRVARRLGVDYRYLFMRPDGVQLAELAQLIDAGTLPVTLDRVFEFADIDQAMAYLEAGHAKGKVVVRR